jgi:small GTP-binding protein
MDVTSVKVVVTGPFAAGKTTLISSLSDIPLVSTEKPVTDETRATKELTTVSMDFGKITFGEGDGAVALYLFGTPGQERFDFMWEVLARGMLGFVVMVDVSRPECVDEARHIIEYFRRLSTVPFVIGANRAVRCPDGLQGLRARLGISEDDIVVACEANERESAKNVLLSLLYEVLAVLDDEPVVLAR